MLIELTGCTGAGKSTLARGMRRACRQNGTDLCMSHDFVLSQIGFAWTKSHLARTLMLDLCSLIACLATWRRNRQFCVFAVQAVRRLHIPLPEKLNLVRNILKKVGIYEIIRRRASDRQIILVDEGTLHAAHNLFVHVSVPVDSGAVSAFARLVPLPDVAIYVNEIPSVLVQRTLRRGHKRVRDTSFASVESFVQRAVALFDQLMREASMQRGLLTAERHRNILVSHTNAQLALATKLVGAGMNTTTVGIAPDEPV